MMKRLIFSAVVLAAVVAAVGYAIKYGTFSSLVTTNKISVVASFYPMGEFTRQVGGDRVSVTTLVKPGVEPHDYEPSATDLVTLSRAKALVYNGAGLEKWVDKAAQDLQKNGGSIIEASVGIDLADSADPDEPGTDPHVWMDPVLAKNEVENIKEGLIKADPAGKSIYEHNAAIYEQRLADLDGEFRTGLATCQKHDIVTSHAAFGYLSHQYGLNQVPIAGLSPEEEPSPQKLAETADFVRTHNVSYIFFETLVSPKLSQTIATETGAKTIAFNPLEGLTDEELSAGKDYISVQKDNLANLRTALHCS